MKETNSGRHASHIIYMLNKRMLSRRMLLGSIQHAALALAALIVVMVFHGSIVRVNGPQGSLQYRMDSFEQTRSFEETSVFHEMFCNAIKDLIAYVELRNEFETDGVYDGKKQIVVTASSGEEKSARSQEFSAVYTLDDLLRWCRSGIEIEQLVLTKKNFVNYFNDDLLDISHFYLDTETGALRYSGRAIENRFESIKELFSDEMAGDPGDDYWDSFVEAQINILKETYDNYRQYNEEQMIEMAFSYVASNMENQVTLTEDGMVEYAVIQVLKSDCTTVDGLTPWEIAGNWIDYCRLENSLMEVLSNLSRDYSLYEEYKEIYAIENTNLRYLFRIQYEDANQSYTNLSEGFTILEADELEYYFQEIGSYLIYYVGEIVSDSNTDITAEEMYQMVRTQNYPLDTILWVGLDETYPVDGDVFSAGRHAFRQVISHIGDYIFGVVVCILTWLGIWVYLSYTAGHKVVEGGETVIRINTFDKIYTEFILAAALGLLYFFRRAYYLLKDLVYAGDYPAESFLQGVRLPFTAAVYIMAAVFGFAASFFFCVIWYSLIRRVRSGNLWNDSFLHWLYTKLYTGVSMVLYHKNSAIRTLIPYNCYLMINLTGIAAAYLVRSVAWLLPMVILGILVFDALVGMYLFRNNAEMVEIVEAIKRIRQGEVEYRLEAERLHGENREIAEAVNNISEGIRNAVATSVKDERLKSDLITNVSHDIKTPLTSVINYVDLLKREKITQEPVKSYIEILDTKTQRLKQLTDDLVEASKISSGNIVLQNERLNLTELLNQSIGELSDKFEEKKLQIVFTPVSAPVYILADSRRMWRVIENLFHNICKYSMPNTRVYIDMQEKGGSIEVSFKNVSSQQLNVRAEDLTERFIRGDESRTTEGSGLGLSIAKNLTELQNGHFRIDLDGDLFKVLLSFPVLKEDTDEE